MPLVQHRGWAPGAEVLLALGFAALGAASVLVMSAPYGPGTSPDSVTYLSVARSLAWDRGFVRFDDTPYTAWPPLYPWLLSLGVRAGIDAMDAARWLGAGSFAVALLALFGLLRRSSGLPWAIWGCVLAFGTHRLIRTFGSAWSEAPFIALVMLGLYLAQRFDPRPRRRDLVLLGLVAGACCLTRYLGVALLGGLALWLLGTEGGWRERLERILLLGSTAAAGPLLWILDVRLTTGLALGGRGDGYADLHRNLREFLKNTSIYLHLSALEPWHRVAAAVVLVGLPALVLVLWMRRRTRSALPAGALVAACFLLLYSSLLVGIASWTPVARLVRVRLGAPLWLPFVVLLVATASAAWRRWPKPLARLAICGALLAYTGWGVHTSVYAWRVYRAFGVGGYGRVRWHDSELLAAVRRNYTGQTVLSNRPHVVYLYTVIPAGYGPRRHHYRSERELPESLDRLRERLEERGSVQLAWFFDYPGGYGYYRPLQLHEAGFCIRGLGLFSDGALYRIDPAADCGKPGREDSSPPQSSR